MPSPSDSSRPALDLARLRLRGTLRSRLGGYLSVLLLVALLGGVSLAAITAARRTDSSYARFLATTNPSDLFVQPTTQGPADCDSPFFGDLTRLAHVQKVECASALDAATLTPSGRVGTILLTRVELVASADGLFSDLDRVTITAGRRPEPRSLDQVVASPAAASLLHLHVGSTLEVGIDAATQTTPLPVRRVLVLHVVGLGVLNHQIVQDDIDRDHTGILLGSPALARAFSGCCTEVPYDALKATGASEVAAVDREYAALVRRVNPQSPQLLVYESSVNEAANQRAIRPQAIALGVFGGIAGLAALVIALLAVVRQLRAGEQDAAVLRSLGASPGETLGDALLGLELAILLGALGAAGVAFALSPVTEFGPVHAVDPFSGWHADWTVLGLGTLALAAVLGGAALVVALHHAPHRLAGRADERRSRSAVVHWAASAGLPPSGLAGLRFAVEPGRGRSAVPVRSTMVGAVLAIVVAVATLTFGTSLGNLISHPALYGWNFDDALFSTSGFGPLPSSVFTPLLKKDHDVEATAGVWFANFLVGDQTEPALIMDPHAAISPRAIAGHALESGHDIVFGTTTLQELHLSIGDTVTVSGNGLAPIRLRVVGTAALPSIGPTFTTHASMSTGVLIPATAVPAALLDEGIPPVFAGPNALFVRFRPGVDAAAGARSLDRVIGAFLAVARSPSIEALSGGQSGLITVENLGVQRPAEIVNYRSIGATPGVLAGALGAGTVVALAFTLVASVRRRRRDFAVLKTIGFTGGQLSLSVAWQASFVVGVGLAVGIPIGIVFGRWLWELFAGQLSVIVEPAVPRLAIALMALIALALANLIAAVPGRMAARTMPAEILRSE